MKLMVHSNRIFAIMLLIQSCHMAYGSPAEEGKGKYISESVKISDGIILDGILSEENWKQASPVSGFVQQWPEEGQPAVMDTEVRVLHDEKYLYISAVCYDSIGIYKVRANTLTRDFDDNNDFFNISIDGIGDRHTAYVFYTNPRSVKGDCIVLDDQHIDMGWNGIWEVSTSISENYWVAEFAIPWSTLRYERPSGENIFNINFGRGTRRINETSTWVPVPREWSMNNMQYSGNLVINELPKPRTNVTVQPYLLVNTTRLETDAEGNDTHDNNFEYGGEIKWSISPRTVLELTLNTDFAQAEVDDQVINYDRYSVYFPEKRQFFLENASAFTATFNTHLENQPFYSRRIGLDDDGKPIPVAGGARLITRNEKGLLGALVMRQKEYGDSPASNFGVARYKRNVSEKTTLGSLLTIKTTEEGVAGKEYQNYTLTFDGTSMLSSTLTWNYFFSGSLTEGKDGGNGMAASSWLLNRSSKSVSWLVQSLITKGYNPEAGFINRGNIIYHAAGYRIYWQPSWKPASVRMFVPVVMAEHYNDASTGKWIEGLYSLIPVNIKFESGSSFRFTLDLSHQNIDEPFTPLGVEVATGNYNYLQAYFLFESDLSKKLSFTAQYRTGGFYDGNLNRYRVIASYNPIPNISLSADCFITAVNGLGIDSRHLTATTLSGKIRLALNPRLQLTAGYQMNSLSQLNSFYTRLSWEIKPLSFLYFIANSGSWQDGDLVTNHKELIGKLSYIIQF